MNPLLAIGIPLFAVATANLSLGAFLLARRRRHPLVPYAAALAFVNAVYALVMGLAYARAGVGVAYDFWYRSAWVGWVGLAPVAQIVLALKGDRLGARRWGGVLYALWGAILVLCWTTDLVEGGAVSLVPFVDRVGRFEQPARALGALVLVWALVEMARARRAGVGRARQQIGYFLLGLALYAAAGLLLAGVGPIVGVHFDPGLVSYFSVVWMGFTVYAITRHRLFDVRIVLSRVLMAIVLTAAVAGFDVLLFDRVAPLAGAYRAMVVVAVASGVAFFMTPVVAGVRYAIDRFLFRHRYDHRAAVKASAELLASLTSVDDVLRQLLDLTRQTIGTVSGALLLRDGDAFRLRQAYGFADAPDILPGDGALARWLAARDEPFVRDEQEIALPPDEFAGIAAELRPFAGEIALPIRYRRDVLGILVLGRKADDDAFLQVDVDLLETFASEAAIAVTNARLVEELQQAIRVRDDFLSVAGHELRTPLTALQLSMQTVARMPPTDARVPARLAAAERQVARLTRLTKELLDVSRITAHRMTLEREPTDLADVVRDVAARLDDDLGRAGTRLDLALQDGAVGSWDRLRLEQVVTNLLSNAVKYGGGEPIAVAVERNGERARLTVRDRGIGIPEADQRRIFERFERAVAPQHFGGFGLGLWIAKQLVDAHGGSITVRSAPGEGSTFVVELPTSP